MHHCLRRRCLIEIFEIEFYYVILGLILWGIPFLGFLAIGILLTRKKRYSNRALAVRSVIFAFFLSPLISEVCMINCVLALLPSGFVFPLLIISPLIGEEVGDIPWIFIISPLLTGVIVYSVLIIVKNFTR